MFHSDWLRAQRMDFLEAYSIKAEQFQVVYFKWAILKTSVACYTTIDFAEVSPVV